jgi:hypothetical protein
VIVPFHAHDARDPSTPMNAPYPQPENVVSAENRNLPDGPAAISSVFQQYGVVVFTSWIRLYGDASDALRLDPEYGSKSCNRPDAFVGAVTVEAVPDLPTSEPGACRPHRHDAPSACNARGDGPDPGTTCVCDSCA